MLQLPEFDELIESYDKLKKRKFRIIFEETNPQDEEIQDTVNQLKSVKSDSIPGHEQAFHFKTYSLHGGEGSVHVQLPGQSHPLPLTKNDGSHIEGNWKHYAKAFRKSIGRDKQDTTGDFEEQLPVTPDVVQPLEDPLGEEDLPQQLPGQIPGQDPAMAFMFDDLNKVGDHMEDLLDVGFFQEIETGVVGGVKRIDWQDLGGNLRQRLISGGTRSLLHKLTSQKAMLFGKGIGVYEKGRITPAQAAQVATNFAKATKIVRNSVYDDSYTLENVAELNQLVNIDVNGVWIKGDDLPEYGVSLGGKKRSRAELMHDPYINMFASYDKKAREKLGIPSDDKLLNLSFTSKRQTQLSKYGDVQNTWNNFLGTSYEKFPKVLAYLQKGNHEKAAQVLSEIMKVSNINSANFIEYIAGIRQGEIPMTETGVDGTDLYDELVSLTGGDPTAAGLVKLYGDFSVRNYRHYAPDGVVHVGAGDVQIGVKTDTSYVFNEENGEKAQAMAVTLGMKGPMKLVPASKVFATPEDAVSQGFNPDDLVFALPVSKKITWGKGLWAEKLFIGKGVYNSVLALPTSVDAMSPIGGFLLQNSNFVSERDPQVADRVHNYVAGVAGKLDSLTDMFKRNIVDHDPDITTRDLAISLIKTSMEDEGFTVAQTTGELRLIDELQEESAEYKKTKDPELMRSYLRKVARFKTSFTNSYMVAKFVNDGASDPNLFPQSRLARRGLGYMLLNTAGSENPVGVEVNDLTKGETSHFNQKDVIEGVVRDLIGGGINMVRDGHAIRLNTVNSGTIMYLNFSPEDGGTMRVSLTDAFRARVSTPLVDRGTEGASLVEEYVQMTRKMFAALLEEKVH